MGCGLNSSIHEAKDSVTEKRNSIILTKSATKSKTVTPEKPFQTQKLLTQDLNSQTFLCTQSLTKQKFVLKVIKNKSLPAHMLDSTKRIKEVEVLRALDHPNIVKCFEILGDTSETKLLFEYIQGGTLLEYRKKRVSIISESKLASIIIQILLALRFIHERGIVHRNIMLENVFVNIYTNLQIKLGDFSCASFLPTAFCPGTSQVYLAPEASTNKFTEKSDMWSFGILLFILATGKMPYSTKKTDLIQAVKNSPVNTNIKEIHALPKDFAQLLNSLLTKDPNQRFSAAQALEHPWLQKYYQGGSLNANFVQTFARPSQNSFQKAILEYICKFLLENQTVNEFSKYFKQIDKDQNGTIEREELLQALRCKYNAVQAEAIAKKFFSDFDANGNGVIDYTEFLIGVCGPALTDEHLGKVFKAIDRGGCERITIEELSIFTGVPIPELEDVCGEKALNFSAFRSHFINLS